MTTAGYPHKRQASCPAQLRFFLLLSVCTPISDGASFSLVGFSNLFSVRKHGEACCVREQSAVTHKKLNILRESKDATGLTPENVLGFEAGQKVDTSRHQTIKSNERKRRQGKALKSDTVGRGGGGHRKSKRSRSVGGFRAMRLACKSRLEEMREKCNKGEKLSQSYCDKALGLCVASNEWDSVLEVLDVMKQQNLSQERSTYRACLQCCFEAGNGSSALEILDAMRQALVEPDSVDIQLVVATLCKSNRRKPGMWHKGLSLLRNTADNAKDGDGIVAVEAYDAVLFCMGEERKWVDSLKLLRLMEQGLDPSKKSFHPTPVLSTYHAVLETCVASSQAEQAVQLLNSMPGKGITPTSYTFELAISALSKKQQWRRAVQLLDMMDNFNVTHTPMIYNIVMSCCAKAGEVGRAMNLLSKMRKRGIRPTTYTFNSLMSACAGTARWKDALLLLDQCHREPGVNPDVITYTNAMRACARGGETKRALGLLDVVKDKGLEPDVYCYTSVIDACAKGRMWRRALELLDEMKENGIPPNEITYSVAIAACGNGGQWRRALELLDQMRENDMPINTRTYNAAITALSKASRQNMKQAARTHGPDMTESRKEQVSQQIDEDKLWLRALDLLEQMEQSGVERDAFSYSAAISACGSGGRWQEALDLIRIMQRGGPRTRPNKVTYTAAISACGRSGEWEHALQLFTDMKSAGLQPDCVAYNALVSALRVANQADKAYEIWGEMCGKKQTSSNAIATARADSRFLSPDIITLTDVLATLDRAEGISNMEKADEVFSEAVERGILLRSNTLDALWEVDLSGMSLPVARAACRYIFRRAMDAVNEGAPVQDITLITGVGRGHRPQFGRKGRDGGGESFNSSANETAEVYYQDGLKFGTTALREYVREILRDDFEPPVDTIVPKYAQGTVQATKEMVQKWIDGQRKEKDN